MTYLWHTFWIGYHEAECARWVLLGNMQRAGHHAGRELYHRARRAGFP